jgi:hypothetical protein
MMLRRAAFCSFSYCLLGVALARDRIGSHIREIHHFRALMDAARYHFHFFLAQFFADDLAENTLYNFHSGSP